MGGNTGTVAADMLCFFSNDQQYRLRYGFSVRVFYVEQDLRRQIIDIDNELAALDEANDE